MEPARTGIRWITVVPWAVYLTGLAVLARLAPAPDRFLGVFVPLFLAVQVLGIGLSLYVATRKALPGRIRRTWLLVAAAWVPLIVSGVGLGQTVTPGSDQKLVWAGAVCRVLAVAILLAALRSYPQRPMSRRERRRFALDLLTVVGAGSTVMWYFLLGPALTGAGVSATTLLTMGYAVGSLVALFGLGAVLLRGGAPAGRQPLMLLVAGVALYALGDLYLSYKAVNLPGSPPQWQLGVCMVTGAFLMALGAAEQVRRPAPEVRALTATGPRVTRLPYVAVAVGVALLLLAAAREGKLFPWAGLAVGVALMTAAVGMRQLLALRDLHALLMTDPLTGLANRVRLHDKLGVALERDDAEGHVGLLLIDLDGFKGVNDTLGHEAGDELLTAFADRLRDVLPGTALPARLGGDEFAVLLTESEAAAAVQVAQAILAAIEEPVSLLGQPVTIRASIGIAVASGGATVRQLLRDADLAMYEAKRRGGRDYELTVAETGVLVATA